MVEITKREDLLVSDEPAKILTILGYDAEVFECGFQSLENLFEFFVTSKWFRRTLFTSDKRNAFALKAERKFKLYRDFEKWSKDAELREYGPKHELVPESLLLAGPEFIARYQEYRAQAVSESDTRQKLSRAKVKQVAGCSSTEADKLLAFIRAPFSTDAEWTSLLESLSLEQAEQWIRQCHEN